jgi:hypothetical protein
MTKDCRQQDSNHRPTGQLLTTFSLKSIPKNGNAEVTSFEFD